MAKNKDAVAYAKQIIALRAFKPKADPKCISCGGKGRYETTSHHNGDYYDTDCECTTRHRPVVSVHQYDDELLLLAKHYLKGH